MAELFNRMPIEALKDVPALIAKRIGDFMIANGYRIVFDRWYLQADPKGPEGSTVEPRKPGCEFCAVSCSADCICECHFDGDGKRLPDEPIPPTSVAD